MRLHAAASPGEVRVAAVDDFGLLDYAIWRPGAPDGVGDLWRGRITAVMPAMAGVFVEVGGTAGFLPDSGAGHTPQSVGSLIDVRVVRAAQGGKGPRLTGLLTPEEAALCGSGDVRLVRQGPTPIIRLARLHPGAPVVVDDVALLAALRPELGNRVSQVASAFDEDLETTTRALEDVAADLPGGARMSVHPTPALTAIDIDLGSLAGERSTKSRAHLAGNIALLPSVARQIRLRNLSGAILIDLAGLSPKRRTALGPALVQALSSDNLNPRFFGFTALGLAEIVRARIHPPLHEFLGTAHAVGLGALRHLAREIVVRPDKAPVLVVAPALASALEHDAVARADLARRAGRPLILREDRGLAPLGWRSEA